MGIQDHCHICTIFPAAPKSRKLKHYLMATNNTLDGGYEALLQWYHQTITSHLPLKLSRRDRVV
jgi:hypothetical protein